MTNSRVRKNSHKRKRWKQTVGLISMSPFFLLAIFIGYYYIQIKKTADQTYKDIDRENIPSNEVKSLNDPFTVLVMGIEDYMDGVARTDVLLFNVINPKSKEVAMLTIPRDAYVYLEVRGFKDKINHAYAFGGKDETLKTVYNLLGIPIDYYISTNFNGFTDLVDAVGGVNVNVPFTFEAKMVDPSEWKTFEEGPAHLNGREALAYVRMRKTDPEGDFGRSKRQKEVIKAIADKAISIGGITKLDNILKAIGNNVQTNIPYNEYLAFMNLAKDFIHVDIDSIQLEGTDERIENIYYYILDETNIEKVTAHLKEMMSHTDPSQALTFEERIAQEEATQNLPEENPNLDSGVTTNSLDTEETTAQ